MENEQDYAFLERKYNMIALKSRCYVHEMKKSYKNHDKFPYNEIDLARYMNYQLDQMSPLP